MDSLEDFVKIKEYSVKNSKIILNNLLPVITAELERIPPNRRIRQLNYLHPELSIISTPSLCYIYYNINKKISLNLCAYFETDDALTNKCSLGKTAETTCTGIYYNTCSWHNLGGFIKELTDFELNVYFNIWLLKIAKRYEPSRMIQHLEKHLLEEKSDYHNWVSSAENLLLISKKVPNLDLNLDLIKKYELIVSEYKSKNSISVMDKMNLLLRHYQNHFDTATPLPLSREYIKDFKALCAKIVKENIDLDKFFLSGF
ncbi:Uncharacterised protein [Candidatus Tiddalikarchaeum anstoanum]|nr:Uncharacterised protein [Candidatus Tiddalikarchaeum anstoanum]